MSDTPDSAVVQERKKIAKILHDGLCQDLMGATMLAQVLAANLSSEQHHRADEAIALRKILIKASEDFHEVYSALEPKKDEPSISSQAT